MKKRHILSLLLCVSMFFCFFTVPVHASGGEFAVSENGESVFLGFNFSGYRQTFASYGDSTCYFIYVFKSVEGSTYYDRCEVAISPDSNFYMKGANNTNRRQTLTYSEEYGFYYKVNNGTDDYNYDSGNYYLINSNLTNMSNDEILEYVLPYYNAAINPASNWGNPADVSISTKYSGNVQNSPSNIDKFTWNNNVDSNGVSYITHLMEHPIIEVQAVPITWKTSTRQEMENQTGADATVGTGVVLDSYNARTGHLEITWQEVINYLQIEYADIYSYFFDGQYWISRGWFYQIRLVADGYTGEWITLSNGLNLSPTKNKKLIEDPYDETIYNILKEISENNDQTTTVYEYGDTYITINNDPTSGWQGQDGGGTFWDFLASVIKAISDGIASIVSSVASLVGDIIDGVLGLFTFDSFTINNYDTEVQTIKENSGIFGQSVEFADSIKDSIRGVQQQPAVLHFDGIVIDNVQLIPAVDLDFDQMVVDAGLTDFHNLVYVFTDGTILISLIIMVHHKLMEVLRK